MTISGCQCQVSGRGPSDITLLSPCESTFWKTTYTRTTNFAVGELELPFNSACGFGRQKFSCKVSRSGDLLSGLYVSVVLPRIEYPAPAGGPPAFSLYNPTGTPLLPGVPSYASYVNEIGHAMFNDISLNIGQHEFDRHTAEYMAVWEAISAPSDRLLTTMTGRYSSVAAAAQASLLDQHLYIPMSFFFARFPEQALPLVALYWHDVELNLSTKPLKDLIISSGSAAVDLASPAPTIVLPTNISMCMMGNFVYLDRPERAAFANSKSEYVIDQVEFLGADTVTATTGTRNHNIRFNHPVQELIWAYRSDAATAALDWFNFSGPSATIPNIAGVSIPTDPFETAAIYINNHDRTPEHPAVYYRTVQPFQTHSRIPAPDRMVYGYSFGLKPEELLNSGTLNMSRLDNAHLRVKYHAAADPIYPPFVGSLFVFARNKNLVKIVVGMAGLRFAS